METHPEKYEVLVIGGGAAGMMAAGHAAERGKRVLLMEKNRKLGEKVAISGGRRCNIFNAKEDTQELLSQYGAAEQFLYSPYSQFSMRDAWQFFEGRGLPLKVEAKGRAFPRSERAGDVVELLRDYLKEGNVTVKTGAAVTDIVRKGKRIEAVVADGVRYSATTYILATGGVSHPETGSTGDGFPWLRSLGHTVMEPTPTIVPLRTKESWVKDVAGVSVDARLTFFVENVRKFTTAGPVLFTHFGISGPTVLNAAGTVADLLQEGAVTVRLDLFPKTDLGILDKEIAGVFDLHKNKALKNVLKEIAPKGMGDTLLTLAPALDPEKKVHSVTKEERRMLADLLKGVTLTVTGLMGFEKAVVADGGVPLTEIDMRTMRSQKIDNLFIVGDLLHINRPTGGYSLQLCWTTGFVAGEHA